MRCSSFEIRWKQVYGKPIPYITDPRVFVFFIWNPVTLHQRRWRLKLDLQIHTTPPTFSTKYFLFSSFCLRRNLNFVFFKTFFHLDFNYGGVGGRASCSPSTQISVDMSYKQSLEHFVQKVCGSACPKSVR